MKKRLLTIGVLPFFMLFANAATRYMIVEQKSGDKFNFLIADKPVVTFKNGDLVVNGNPETSYAISGVKNYHFTEKEDVFTGVNSVEDDVVRIEGVDNTLLLKNVAEAEKVVLVNANGVVVKSTTANSDGIATIVLPSQKGVYVVVVGRQSFKFIRK